jgi:hypothetical protein
MCFKFIKFTKIHSRLKIDQRGCSAIRHPGAAVRKRDLNAGLLTCVVKQHVVAPNVVGHGQDCSRFVPVTTRPLYSCNELRTTTQNYNDAIHAIEATSKLSKAFPTQTPPEQRRLLKTLVEKATWKDGELETTLRNPFQKLRLSNHATNTKHEGNGTPGQQMENWLPR